MSRTTAPLCARAAHPHRLRTDLPCTDGRHNPDLWFRSSIAGAVALCRLCPVMDDCREWAIATCQCIGVWGGMGPTQIQAAHRRRKAKAGRT